MLYGPNLNYLKQHLRGQHISEAKSNINFLLSSLVYQGHAYYARHVPAERMLEVVVEPFLRLTEVMNKPAEHPAGPSAEALETVFKFQQCLRNNVLEYLDSAVLSILKGTFESIDCGRQLIPGVTIKRRSKLAQAVIQAGYVQVAECLATS